MVGGGKRPGSLRLRARDFLLGGSCTLGLLALVLHSLAWAVVGREELLKRMPEHVEYWRGEIRTSGWEYVLTHFWLDPEELYVFGGTALAALGAALALLAFMVWWRRPIPAALALVLNIMPSLISLGLVLQAKG